MLLWVIIGFVAGWLINVIADRAPLRLSLTVPRCPECDTPRPFRQWSGLIAYFTGQSLCLHCRRRIAFRWALVELTTPVLFAVVYALTPDPLALLILSFHTAVLILVCVIDFEHRLILNVVMFPVILIAAALGFFTPNLRPQNAIAGGLTGLALTGLIYLGGQVFMWAQARRGRALSEVAFGQGDVTLMLYIGLITGLLGVLRALALGVVFGGIVAFGIVIFGAVRRQSALHIPFAYGPYLSLGGWVVLIQNLLTK